MRNTTVGILWGISLSKKVPHKQDWNSNSIIVHVNMARENSVGPHNGERSKDS